MPFADVGDVRPLLRVHRPRGRAADPAIRRVAVRARQNFDSVNDGLRENFRLLSFDAYRLRPLHPAARRYSIEGWADEGAGLLDALGIDRVLTTARRWAA